MGLLLELDPLLAASAGFGRMRGSSAPMQAMYQQIQRVAPTEATVLLAGETGTGKEVVARTIHELSNRCNGAFVALNCGAISPQLIESELFGHEQGSFTGANRMHNGVFAQADKGTLFLDEITEMSMDMQVKLLRVLETGQFHRVGGEHQVRTNARVIAAANRSPEDSVRDGRMREDLYYRLRVFPIALPPLRNREDDIELLALHFLEQLNALGNQKKRFTVRALAALRNHSWPGNVRELKHFVQRAFILADRDLDEIAAGITSAPAGSGDCIGIRVGCTIAEAEQVLITATLQHLGGHKAEAAHVLGISLKTLYSRLNVYSAARSARS